MVGKEKGDISQGRMSQSYQQLVVDAGKPTEAPQGVQSMDFACDEHPRDCTEQMSLLLHDCRSSWRKSSSVNSREEKALGKSLNLPATLSTALATPSSLLSCSDCIDSGGGVMIRASASWSSTTSAASASQTLFRIEISCLIDEAGEAFAYAKRLKGSWVRANLQRNENICFESFFQPAFVNADRRHAAVARAAVVNVVILGREHQRCKP